MEKVDRLAKIIWDYHKMNQELGRADCIFCLGSHDLRVAKRAAELYLDGWAPWLIFSGGFGRLTEGIFDKPEAEVFAEVAIKMGVQKEKIIIENRATNTGENVQYTKALLNKEGLDFESFILVQKPYMERRTFATFRKLWSEKECVVTSPQMTFEEYANGEIPIDDIINIMIGDLQRIKIYAEKGFQIHQEIPEKVWEAYKKLVQLGYDKHLVKE